MQQRTPRADYWRKASQEVAKLADRLGKPIDRDIALAVTALRAHKFDTTWSCQGHLRWGEPAPSVDVGVHPMPEEHDDPARKTSTRMRRLRVRNLTAQRRLLALLDGFYQQHVTDATLRLVLIPFGIYGGFTLRNQGAEIQTLLPSTRRRSRLAAFQREFELFASFLRSRL